MPKQTRWLISALALAAAYYVAARLGLLLAFAATNVSPVWPPSGIALAALLLFGYRVWPGILLGAFAANLVVFAANDAAGATTIAVVASIIALGNTLEALLGALLLHLFVKSGKPFDQPQDVFRFALIALFMCTVGATVGAAALIVSGIAQASALSALWSTWWLGDVAGVLTVAPALLTWGGKKTGKRAGAEAGTDAAPETGSGDQKPPHKPEAGYALVMVAVLAIVSALVFGGQALLGDVDRPLIYLFIPVIAWAAYRYGARGVAVVSLLITGIAVAATTQGYGPFAKGDLNGSLIGLEVFIGLCTVTGLVLAADLAERKHLLGAPARWRDVALPWATLLASIAVTVLGWHVIASESERIAGERFDFLAGEIRSRVVDRLRSAEQILRAAAGLFAVSASVERNEWRDYIARLQLEKNFPGVQGVGHLLVIPSAEKEAHIQRIRAEGFPDYSIKPDGERDEYVPIVYIEPFNGRNLRAFGYDMFSEPVRRAAMMAARDTGETAISGKVTLVQETDQDVQAGVLMYLPIYRNGAPAASVDQRRAALSGYVYSPFRMNDLLAGILGRELIVAALEIFDGDAPERDTLLYDSRPAGGSAGPGALPMFTSLAMFEIANRSWTFRFTSLPAFEETIDRQKAQVVLVAGIIISLLLFILVRSLAMTRERALALANDMTAAVRESEAKFSSLAESANEAIVISDAAGNIVSWNPCAESIFGYASQETLGRDLTLIMPERYRAAHRRGIAHIGVSGRGQLIGKTVEFAGLRKDGSEFPLELSLATWETQQGRFYSGVIRDISEQKRNQHALIESKALLDLALIGSSLALFDWDIATGKVYLSEEWAHFIGAPAGPTLTTFDALGELVHPDDRANLRTRIADALKGVTEFYRAEHRVRTHAGVWKWIQSHGKVVQRDASGRALQLTGTNADIDERKSLETDLAQRNELLNAVLENIEAGIVVCDAAGTLTLFNRATREFHNLPQEPLPPMRWAEHYDLCRPDGTAMATEEIPLFKALQEKPVRDQELIIMPKHGGKKRVLLASGQALFGRGGEKLGAVVAMHDITEHRRKEQTISAALREKETLLKEVYHRVKNNLQVITSLFNLQIRTLPDGHARTALQESANRVRAMALVHEKLYQSGNLSSINLKSYIDDLCHRLGAAAGASERGVDIVSVVEAVDVGLEAAVPLGLILNELVTNSLNHAFPEGRKGILSVVLERFDDGTALLTVADDGVGMAIGAAPRPAALGVKLVETLSRQLDGELAFEIAGGTRVRLRFPVRS